MIGFFNIWKNSGDGSTYVVGKVKRKLGLKCGHMGTLDPMASGVLPIGTDKATRLFDFLLEKQKTYIAQFEFGYLTDTLDSTGKVLKSGGRIPENSEIMRETGHFVGEIEQIPPNYSAKNIEGKRGYELARKGVEFTLPPKRVKVDAFEFLERNGNSFSFRIDCRGGTYIRSLARDLGERLGTYGTMTALKRTRAGIFTEENSVPLREFLSSDDPFKYAIPADAAVDYNKKNLSRGQAERLLNGLPLKIEDEDGLYRVYAAGEFWGIGEIKQGVLKMRAYCREV